MCKQLTDHDKAHCQKTAEGLVEGRNWCPHCSDEKGEDTYCESDCYTSEIVMLSTGYADVWYDGEVVQCGRVVWTAEVEE